MLTRRKKLIGLAALATLALGAMPAMAQDASGRQHVYVYGGQMFGDDLTQSAVSGRKPELDDDVTYGVRYGYDFTKDWGIELSLGQTATSVTGLGLGRDIDLDLTTLDVDAVWNFDLGSRIVPYVVAGIGYAAADLDRPIVGTVNGRTVSIDDDESFTANAGVGAKFFATDRFLVRLEARYRYIDGLVDDFSDSLGTVETTLGVGWSF